jgi:hypothetical protein
LIQRLLPVYPGNAPQGTEGTWLDEDVVRDLTADDAQQAVETVARQGPPELVGATRRAVKWEHVSEFTSVPVPSVSVRDKKAPK